MARTFQLRCRWLTVAFTLALLLSTCSAGCGTLLTVPFMLFGPDPDSERFPPEYTFYSKATQEKHKRDITLVVLPYHARSLPIDYSGTDLKLANAFAAHLTQKFKDNHEPVTVVPIHEVEKFKQTHPEWKSMGPKAIGEFFKADYILDMELSSLSLMDKQSRQQFLLGNIRVSPFDDRIAFVDHPVRHDDAGAIKIVDEEGKQETVSAGWASVSGLAWKSTREVWFTATRDAAPRSLWSMNMAGNVRSVGQAPGNLTLRDIAPDGRVLVTVESRRLEMAARISQEENERDVSLTDWSRVQQLSGDGSLLLFDESGEGSGSHPVSYVRNTRTGEVVRLGEGYAQGFAFNDASALLISEDRKQLLTVPVSGGAASALDDGGVKHQWVRFFPDGEYLLALAARPGEPLKLYVRPLRGTKSVPITGPLMVRNVAIAPDGKTVAALTPEGKLALFRVPSGEPTYLPSDGPLAPIRWSRDGEWLFVQHLRQQNSSTAEVSKVRVATGDMRHWRTIAAADPIGVNSITGIVISDDERSYAYSYRRVLSVLYVASGWR